MSDKESGAFVGHFHCIADEVSGKKSCSNYGYTVIYGKGIVDLTYPKKIRDGKKVLWTCPYFERWRGLIRRCYSGQALSRNPTYLGCEVCEEWLTFSKFKSWMESCDWVGKELDKDLLIKGNKLYSPETCLWLPHDLNIFICRDSSSDACFSTGTCLDKETQLWRAQCSNPFEKDSYYKHRGYIGFFRTQKGAHNAWKNKKREYAKRYAEMQTDPVIKNALLKRYE